MGNGLDFQARKQPTFSPAIAQIGLGVAGVLKSRA